MALMNRLIISYLNLLLLQNKTKQKQYLRQWLLVQSPLAMYLMTLNNVPLKVSELVNEKLNLLDPHFGPHNWNSINPYAPLNYTVNGNYMQNVFNNLVKFTPSEIYRC